METGKNLVVFYDSPCVDGAASAWIIHEALKNAPDVEVDYVPIGYGRPEERTRQIMAHLRDGVEALFVDNSPKDDTLALLFTPPEGTPRIAKLTVVDHHASEVARMKQFEMNLKSGTTNAPVGPLYDFHLDGSKPAAALMVWELFNPDRTPPKILEWIGQMEPPVRLRTHRDYAMAAFIDSKDILSPDQIFASISALATMSDDEMLTQGNAILAEQLSNIKKGIHTAMLYTKLALLPRQKMWMPIVNANVQNFGRRINEALLEIACSGTTCGVVAAWCVLGDGTVKMSLRSKGTPNVGAIAQYLGGKIGVGGGGHATDAVVQFKDLAQFATRVKLHKREDMIKIMWEPKKPRPSASKALVEGPAVKA
jgi:nanoRNase/pAp phosphatase (c-di-AMP/oligoRNAs hydrolase)